MTTEIDLLRAIAANPDDDAAKLVYGDWLIQQGSPRGELIQLEIAFARMDDFDDRRKATKARITALYREHGEAWLRPFRGLNIPGVELAFDRGIVAKIRGSSRALAAAAPRILAGAPLVASMTIEVGTIRELDPLAGSPLLALMRGLELTHHTPVRPTGWAALAVPEVRSIVLSSIAAGPEDLEPLLAVAAKLGSLTLSKCRLNRGALEPLARAACPLTKLDMPAHKQGPRLGELLGGNPALRGLVTLGIAGNELGSAGLAALLPALRHVEHLDVRGCGLAIADLERLLVAGVLPRVRELLIGGQQVNDAFIATLASWSGAEHLRKLHLGNAGVTAKAARVLAGSPLLAGLRSLVLTGPRFDAATEAVLVGSPHLATARIYGGDRMLARKPART